jgi:hypothetical protein
MTLNLRRLAALLIAAGSLAVALTLSAAPAPDVTKHETVKDKDRASFIPYRKYQALPEKAIGLLVSDVAPKMSHEGRGGPPDAMGFSAGGNSYRWVYVPVTDRPMITGLSLPVGEKGDRRMTFPQLSMASANTVKQWEITVPYALVEVEVNRGAGAPADEGFAATKMTRLDGTRDYPLDVVKTIAEARKRYAEWKGKQQQTLDGALMEAQKKAIKDRKPTGPRETAELFYVTWLPETKRLSVRFRTTVTDGDYKYTEGFRGRPVPLPLPPKGAPGQAKPAVRFPPPPPRGFPRVRYGTSFGIEYGFACEFNKNGKLVRTLALPAQGFQKELPPPPQVVPPGPPFRLPPPPLPPKN